MAKEQGTNNIEEAAQSNLESLRSNPYPGRGIVIGESKSGDIVQVYWLMGRSENSRNRIMVQDGDTVKTDLFKKDPKADTSLIIYNAMRVEGNLHIVSNGDQTDTIAEHGGDLDSFRRALGTRTYEPDDPNFTPRISAATLIDDPSRPAYKVLSAISIISHGRNGNPVRDFFQSQRTPGIGSCVHTYDGDGNPLPSFSKKPYAVPIGETIDETADMYWDALNEGNKVSLVVKSISAQTGEVEYRIKNKHHEQ